MEIKLKGTCLDMCPLEECVRRRKNKTVHILEKNVKPDDDSNMVKEFIRSAAGQNIAIPELLRPPDCLFRTVVYLLTDVLNREVRWPLKYDFISDRLRSVRQDAVIQQVGANEWIRILPPMIRFYCYASYRLINDKILHWNLNIKCLENCFITLMNIYEESSIRDKYDKVERQEMETLYILVNIDAMYIVAQRIKYFDKILYAPSKAVLDICKNFALFNYFQIFKNIRRLPKIHQCVFYAIHGSVIRRTALRRIFFSNTAGKNIGKYPVSKIASVLAYNSEDQFRSICLSSNLHLSEQKDLVTFTKQYNIEETDLANSFSWKYLEESLDGVDISSMILKCTAE